MACTAVPAQSGDPEDLRLLAGLSTEEWSAVNRGEVQARVLDTEEKREVAVVGVARVRAGIECFVPLLQDIETFKKSPDVLRIRKFDSPPGPHALDGFGIEAGDVAALRTCKTGDCDVKLPARAMERLARSVDWNRPGHTATVESIVRDEMRAYIDAYVDQGNAALIEYHDKKKPVRLADEFRGLLDGRPRVADFAPQFQTYLARYPNQKLAGVRDFFYWSEESFGLGPVTSVTHVSVYVQPGEAVAVSKQIFASHYFDASLGLTVAMNDAKATSGSGMYLLYLNRSRVDLLGGFLGGLRRVFVRGRMRDGMRNNLTETVRKLESSCAADPKAPLRGQ